MRIAYPCDEHFPWQDDSARSVALQIVRDFNPDVRIAGSDGVDFYPLSRFDKNPERLSAATTQKEIDLWKGGQREWIDASPNAKAYHIMGNHEMRMLWYLYKHPEFYDLDALKIENVLGFASLGIEKAPRNEFAVGQLVIRHGQYVNPASALSAKKELERLFYSATMMTGHTHRGGSHFVTTRRGIFAAYECFCLCDLEPEYVIDPNWQQGITLVTMHGDIPHVEQIPFFRVSGKVIAYWRDKEYSER